MSVIDLQAIVLERAAAQLVPVRLDQDEHATWAPRRTHRCADCRTKLQTRSASPLCGRCQKPARRATCFACDHRAEVRGYCRRHWEHIRANGLVDPLHIDPRREGLGAPKGRRFV